jgi:type I restriction enzyme, S subunit
MPDGWRAIALGDIAVLSRGISYRSEDLHDVLGVPFLTLKCVDRGGGFRMEGLKRFTGEAKARHRVQPGNLCIANTDLTRDMAVLGCPILVPDDPAFVNAVFSLDLSKLEIDSAVALSEFVCLVLGQPAARNFMKRHASGTTVMHLQTREVPNLQLLLPPLVEQRRIVDLISAVSRVSLRAEGMRQSALALRAALVADLLAGNHAIPASYDRLVDPLS